MATDRRKDVLAAGSDGKVRRVVDQSSKRVGDLLSRRVSS
jgi:hypothetical protein